MKSDYRERHVPTEQARRSSRLTCVGAMWHDMSGWHRLGVGSHSKSFHPTTLFTVLKLREQMLIPLGGHMPNAGSKRMIQIVDHQIDDIGQERDAEGEQIIEP